MTTLIEASVIQLVGGNKIKIARTFLCVAKHMRSQSTQSDWRGARELCERWGVIIGVCLVSVVLEMYVVSIPAHRRLICDLFR